uniref:Uncharacterized protein n=1 Tax=Rhizophora mucronata TaxID=61149 RepID=A0A2P2MZA5_RHIMU
MSGFLRCKARRFFSIDPARKEKEINIRGPSYKANIADEEKFKIIQGQKYLQENVPRWMAAY